MADAQEEFPSDEPISGEELLSWIEFGCWTSLVLTPFLYMVNGPAVSQDQFVVRIILVILSITGSVGLWIRRRLVRGENSSLEVPLSDNSSNEGKASE